SNKGARMLRTRKLGMSLVVSSLALGFAAGLAVGQMKPPAENKGLGAEALRSLELTEEIDSVKGRALRMRKITLAPGGVIGLHSHKDRPAVSYFLQRSEERRVGKECGAGWWQE